MALTGPFGGWAQLELSSPLTPVAEARLQKAISSQNPAQGVPSPLSTFSAGQTGPVYVVLCFKDKLAFP